MTEAKGRALPRSYEFRVYVIFASLLMLSIIALKQDVLVRFESSLASHMILEHAIFFLIGADSVLAAETLLKIFSARARSTGTRTSRSPIGLWNNFLQLLFGRVHGLVWVGGAVGLMAFWHIPYYFTLAVLHPEIHVLQHISFVAVGASGFIATRLLGDSLRIGLLIAIIGMMGFAGLLFSVLDRPVYPVYTVSDHNETGGYMVMVSTLLLLIGLPAFLIRRSMKYVNAIGHSNR